MTGQLPKISAENGTSKLPLDKAVREHLSAAIQQARKRALKDRPQIAKELSELVGQRITMQQLNEWSAPSGGRRFPAFLVGPFCEVVGDDRLQRFIMGQQLRDLVRLGEVALESDGLLGTYGHGRRRGRKKRRSCRK